MTTRTLPESAPGQYVPYGNRPYYKPDPLPPSNVEIDADLQETLREAVYQLGRLDGVGAETDVNPMLYTTLTRREAVESVVIEGADIDITDVFKPRAAGERVRTDVQEALNYETVIRRGADAVADGTPITLDLLKRLHADLLADTRGENTSAGEFRRKPVHIPPPTSGERPFVPPAPGHVERLMENLQEFVAEDTSYHDLVAAAITHYQFETIHPFEDGNGRLGRILITLQLVAGGYLSDPFLYPSAYFNEHKIEYVRLMRGVSERGEWNPWIRFFVTAIERQASEAVDRTEKLRTLRRRYEREYPDSVATHRLARALFDQPYLTTTDASELLGVTDQTARNAIQALVEDGLLEEVTGKQRYREYKAVEIFELLEP